MVRIAKPTDPVKLRALKDQINDPQYLKIAVERIAINLTAEIVNRTGEQNDCKI